MSEVTTNGTPGRYVVPAITPSGKVLAEAEGHAVRFSISHENAIKGHRAPLMSSCRL